MTFDRIPKELTDYVNWCCWRFEQRETDTKVTKVPYNPLSRKRASSTDPQTWCTYDQALQAVQGGDFFDGIGFFFSQRDPYCGIDLDDPGDDNEARERHQKIMREFDSYAELSPSGKGVHIIIQAKLPQGRRRDYVEMYSTGRFFTMTGNVVNAKPIVRRQELAEELFSELQPTIQHDNTAFTGAPFQTVSDEEIFKSASEAENGDKFLDLWNGNFEQYYGSQSEADFALIDILAYYTQHAPQIARLFHTSALGQRMKAHRDSYLTPMIARAFDRMPPPIDISAIMDTFEGVKAAAHNPTASAGDDDRVTAHTTGNDPVSPPNADRVDSGSLSPVASRSADLFDTGEWKRSIPVGIIDHIYQYCFQSSPRPQPEIALTTALGMLAGIAGRQYNISNTGLNHYIMLIANSGMGKDEIASAISRIVEAVAQPAGDGSYRYDAARLFRGPADMASGQGLLKYMADSGSKSMISVTGEFGIKLKGMTSENATHALTTLLSVLLELYSRSGAGRTVEPTVYADKLKNTAAIQSPAFSLIGESTPERFYAALDEDMAAAGLLPRFLILEVEPTRKRAPYNEGHDTRVPMQLVQIVEQLMTHVNEQARQGKVQNVGATDEAQEYFRQIDAYVEQRYQSSPNDAVREVWNRAHLKVMKMSGLLAVSYNFQTPVVTLEMARWSASLIFQDTLRLLAKFAKGEMGEKNEANLQEEYIRKELWNYITQDVTTLAKVDPTLHHWKIVSRSWLMTRLVRSKPFRKERNPAFAFNNAINTLIENGHLQRLTRQDLAKYTTKTGFHFVVIDRDWLTNVT